MLSSYAEFFSNLFHLSDLGGRILLSITTLVLVLALVKLINLAVGRLFDRKEQLKDGDGTMSGDFRVSMGIFIKVLLFYSGLFVSALLILEIFNIRIISAQDIKNICLIVLKVIAVIVAARLAVRLARLAITQFFSRRKIKNGLIQDRRAKTMESLIGNAVSYLVFFLAGIIVLEIFNVNTSTILASAGILGLAVGFGAQSLVKDVIGGFFIIFEDQFAVGDYVEAGGVTGTVEAIGLRSCKIRKWTGHLHIIPNGSITQVTNYNRGNMLAVADVGIAYEENIDRAMEILRQECAAAYREIPAIVGEPSVQGVTMLGDLSVTIRAIAPVQAGSQWAVERELRRRFKNALDRAGIEIARIQTRGIYPGSSAEKPAGTSSGDT